MCSRNKLRTRRQIGNAAAFLRREFEPRAAAASAPSAPAPPRTGKRVPNPASPSRRNGVKGRNRVRQKRCQVPFTFGRSFAGLHRGLHIEEVCPAKRFFLNYLDLLQLLPSP